jgi:hypothetical protein
MQAAPTRNRDHKGTHTEGIYNHALDDIKIAISKFGITDRMDREGGFGPSDEVVPPASRCRTNGTSIEDCRILRSQPAGFDDRIPPTALERG